MNCRCGVAACAFSVFSTGMIIMDEGFGEFFRIAQDGQFGPYPYQRVIAESGLPVLCTVPTGAGKTAAAVLPWLWRLLVNEGSKAATPHRLVYVLPMRSLVEQTVDEIRLWLERLGLDGVVQLHVLMGGVNRDDDAWQMRAGDPAIFVGTQDMVLSRALMRGYAEPRSRWPVSFGLLHAGTQWVFDETQLLGPALGTSAQLQGLRDALGTALPTASMWMSATLDAGELSTPDHRLDPAGAATVALGPEDLAGDALGPRVRAPRRFTRLALPDDPRQYPAALARTLVERHQPGTQTIAFLNTVERAVAVFCALSGLDAGLDLLLVHSRFRPRERRERSMRLRAGPGAAGRIVVATQALEAGVDVSSRVLFSEAARWSSLVQRAGRCNRAGEYPDGADVLWSSPPKQAAAPYTPDDVAAAERALAELEGRTLTTLELQALPVAESRPVHAVLRRRDLLQLFDTAPDLSGADLDVGPWVRDAEDTTVFMAWRPLREGRLPQESLFPARDELCPAPLADVRKLVRSGRRLWVHDRLSGQWRPAVGADVVPGAVLVADAAAGGYSPLLGWAPASRAPVDPVGEAVEEPDAVGHDGWSYAMSRWVSLTEHLDDVEQDIQRVVAEYRRPLAGLSAPLLRAAALAGRFHDLGKAHPVFQDKLLAGLDDGDALPGEGPWAKSARPGPPHSGDRRLRHELVSALMLLHPDSGLLDGVAEADLVTYLAAAHHGKVRVSVRSLPGEGELMLGVAEGDRTLPVRLPDGAVVAELRLRLDLLHLGAGAGGRSWTARALALRDRADLGPFRLAFLEALVRVADWRVSSSYRVEGA